MLEWSIVRNSMDKNIVNWSANCFRKIMKTYSWRIGSLWNYRLVNNFVNILGSKNLLPLNCLKSFSQSSRCYLCSFPHVIYLCLVMDSPCCRATRNIWIRVYSTPLLVSRMRYIRRSYNILRNRMAFLNLMHSLLYTQYKIRSRKWERISFLLRIGSLSFKNIWSCSWGWK